MLVTFSEIEMVALPVKSLFRQNEAHLLRTG
jgi:hypothetical protein